MKRMLGLLLLFLSVVSILSASGKQEAANGGKSELILYTNQVDAGREEVFGKMLAERNFDFDVVFVHSGGNDMKDRLIAERNNPLADVVLGGSHLENLALVENDIFAPYTPAWASDVDKDFIGPDSKYWPWALDSVHFAYNTALMGGQGQLPAPKDWPDLAKTEYKDSYYFWSANGTTAGILFVSMLVRYADENGVLGVSQEGWDLIESIHENRINPTPSDFREALKSGEVSGGSIWGGGVISVSKNKGIDLEVMKAPVGTPFFPACIGLVNTGKEAKMANAKEFIDWWGSEETQVVWGRETGQAPANRKALNAIGGEIKELIDQLDVQDIDWKFVYENIDSWREKIALEYDYGQ